MLIKVGIVNESYPTRENDLHIRIVEVHGDPRSLTF